MFAHVSARRNHQLLIFAVHQFAHALHQQAFRVALQDRIPLAAPQHFDDVPSRAAERRFQLLNNLPVPAHRPIQPLQIAVHHKNQIVQLLARSQCDRAERFRLVRLAIAQKRPHFRVRRRLQSAIFQIAVVTRLINRHQRAQAHRNRRKFPEIRHQPRVRIRGKPAARLQFAPKIFQLLRRKPCLPETRAHKFPARRAPGNKPCRLRIPRERAAKKMIEPHFIKRRRRSVRRNVPADVVLHAVRAHHHRQRVPADQALDPPLQLLIPGKQRLRAVCGIVFA